MKKIKKSIDYQSELNHMENDKKIPRLLPILFFILLIIIISLLVFVRNYQKNSLFITPSTSPAQVLDLIPGPTDTFAINDQKDAQNTEKINTSTPTPSPSQQPQNSDDNVYNSVHYEPVYLYPLDIITIAPVNDSYITGRTITLAFNTTNPSYISNLKVNSKSNDKLIKIDEFTTDQEQASYQSNHTIPVNIPDNAKKIDLELTLTDQYQQTQIFSLTYYRH